MKHEHKWILAKAYPLSGGGYYHGTFIEAHWICECGAMKNVTHETEENKKFREEEAERKSKAKWWQIA